MAWCPTYPLLTLLPNPPPRPSNLCVPGLITTSPIHAIADPRPLAAIQDTIVAGLLRMESGPLVYLLEEELNPPGTPVKINGTGGDWQNIQAQHSPPLAVGSRRM